MRDQVSEYNVEVVVVDRCGGDTLNRIKKEYPFVTILQANLNHRPSVPELRVMGVNKLETTLWRSLKNIVSFHLSGSRLF